VSRASWGSKQAEKEMAAVTERGEKWQHVYACALVWCGVVWCGVVPVTWHGLAGQTSSCVLRDAHATSCLGSCSHAISCHLHR
jgi:hypothetical protein